MVALSFKLTVPVRKMCNLGTHLPEHWPQFSLCSGSLLLTLCQSAPAGSGCRCCIARLCPAGRLRLLLLLLCVLPLLLCVQLQHRL